MRAFTLVELLIVVVIIGIIATFAIIRYGNVTESARQAEAYAVLAEIVTAEKRYYLDSDPSTYTATITNLDSFSTSTVPASDNFDFTVPSIDVDSGYALATSKVGGSNYWMCLESGDRGPGTPSCP